MVKKLKLYDEEITLEVIERKKIIVNNCEVSIIIRTKNESEKIKECIEKINEQICDYVFEIILIDSGSTDSTIEIAKQYENISIYSIASKDFKFGTSIALGEALANINSQFIVFVSGHAIPANKEWLHNLVNACDNDYIAGSYSKQIYFEDTNFVEKKSLDDSFGNVSKIQEKKNKFIKYHEYKDEIMFSNASSCIKRSVISKIPFRNIVASEDREWAYRVLKNGLKIYYNSNSMIYHAHNENFKQYYRRIFINSKALYEFAGVNIKLIHIIPIFIYRIFKDMRYCIVKKIPINICLVGESVKYSYYYVKAHYCGTRKEL